MSQNTQIFDDHDTIFQPYPNWDSSRPEAMVECVNLYLNDIGHAMK